MKRYIILLVLILSYFVQLPAQTLYTPRNVKAAFENGTRAMNGKPGTHYWQNHANYDIDLTVAPPDRAIKGLEGITYFNESPDTLNSIVFRLTMNYHKPEAIHYTSMDTSILTSGVHIDNFAINGVVSSWHDPSGHFTWQEVDLIHPLLPGDSIHFSLQWHYKISSVFNGPDRTQRAAVLRSGMIDATTWAIAYFYPRIAVYDDVTAWDKLEFTGAQEFYNDFGNYELKVSVPENYIVWATGTLQNPDEVLQPHYAQLLKKSMTSDAVIQVATEEDLRNKSVTTQNPVNTWKWNAKNVTEVALFVSDHDNWDAASAVVDNATGRRTSVQAAYYDSSELFHGAVDVGQKALRWFSNNLPGVAYPYPKMTVVEGFAGMEYPMMVNDGLPPSHTPTSMAWNHFRYEENHEIAHTYFPFYMGTNESRYAFMDEGWAQFLNGMIGAAEYGAAVANERFATMAIQDSSQEAQVPLIEVNLQTGLSYLSTGYIKPMWAYLALKDLLGDQLFKKCLLGYMNRWQGKHPIPWDFFYSFNDVSGKNLNWFWSNWFFSHGYNDVSIGSVIKNKDGYVVTIKNTGGFDIPFDLKINYADGSEEKIHKTPAVWQIDETQAVVNIQTQKKISALVVETGIWVDANEKDNGWKSGIKVEN